MPHGMQSMGEMDLGEVPRQWDQILSLAPQLEQIDRSGSTGRPADSPQARRGQSRRPPRLYQRHDADHLYGVEHIEALIGLLTKHGATPRAPWTLMRPVFEAGFWATWLLEPAEGLERRKRGLRIEVRSMLARTAYYEDMLRTQPRQRDNLAADHLKDERVYRAEADALGLTWSQAKDKTRSNVVDELSKLLVVRNMDPDVRGPIVAAWRVLSGLQHGYAYALVSSSTKHEAEQILGGEERQLLSISDTNFQAFATASNLLLSEAISISTCAMHAAGDVNWGHTDAQSRPRTRDRGRFLSVRRENEAPPQCRMGPCRPTRCHTEGARAGHTVRLGGWSHRRDSPSMKRESPRKAARG